MTPPGDNDGVGCACGWPLDPCNPRFAPEGHCDKERFEGEPVAATVPDPGDEDGPWPDDA